MKGNTILIVDDEKQIIRSIMRVLMDEDYYILGVLSGEEGLSKMEAHDVDVVISDNRMPGMSGVEFLKKVHIAYPQTLTIMLTAYADIGAAMKAINEAGVYKFILKPWNDADLRLTIKRALELRQLVMERNSLLQEVKAREAMLMELERKHPGITEVARDQQGRILIGL